MATICWARRPASRATRSAYAKRMCASTVRPWARRCSTAPAGRWTASAWRNTWALKHWSTTPTTPRRSRPWTSRWRWLRS
ncbi:hypothetical protein G6F63_015268 [Rhizopus arrhizus]|nr:hypothetical protein G6F63_015268 [Rhizopus arrhizus]KAG1337601.1 hypothetical protein G6F61_014926 [Rhizopus arrhizus]